MILVNITFAVSTEAEQLFVAWTKDTFIYNAVRTGGFEHPLLCKILSVDNDSATSYALQMRHHSESEAHSWYERGAGAVMLTDLMQRFGDKILWFITFMDIIE